ncbi:MAG: DUF899 domain-containing protein [Gammaproteobacteria bacterium]|nr:DUF899 domain-containing protein [Gammaproteobacteria bacterium]
MNKLHDNRFPNENSIYREQRDKLLGEELKLRDKLEKVATQRRQLPVGGELPQDYVFDELIGGSIVKRQFSTLFDDGKDTLLLYSFMYAEDADKPCPACNSLLDGLNGSAPHIRDKVSFAAIARAPIEKFAEWGQSRGWNQLRLLSSSGNSYNRDYFGENHDGSQQMPAMNVFKRQGEQIHHTYCTELLFTAPAENQHPRHADLFWPVWNLFDLTPEGRGPDWFPKLNYD